MWPGNYSAFAVAKEIALQRQQQLYVSPAEGDRAAGGGDRALQAVGEHRGRRAAHQAGAQQATPDRPDGQDRPAGVRAAQDRAGDARRAARRAEDRRAARRHDRVRRRPGPARRGPDDHARRARRHHRRERRRQERAREGPRGAVGAHVGGALGGTVGGVRLPGTGARDRAAAPHADRVRAQREADVRGGRGLAARPVPVPLRADAATGRHAVGRGADTPAALPVDAGRRELPAARRAHEPPRHREHGGAGVGAGTVRRDGRSSSRTIGTCSTGSPTASSRSATGS